MENAREASVVRGVDVYPVASLREVLNLLNAPEPPAPYRVEPGRIAKRKSVGYSFDFREVRGQLHAKARH